MFPEKLPFHIKLLRNGVYERLIRRSDMKADRIVVPGNGVKEDLEKYFELDHEKIEVVYNGYQKEAIQELSKEVMEEMQAGIFFCG